VVVVGTGLLQVQIKEAVQAAVAALMLCGIF
jgi:hypothetical protein